MSRYMCFCPVGLILLWILFCVCPMVLIVYSYHKFKPTLIIFFIFDCLFTFIVDD